MTECANQTTPTKKTFMGSESLNNLLTGRDNSTLDLGRLLLGLSFLWVIAHDAYQLHGSVASSPKDLAYALAALLAGGGAGIGFKGKTEPGGE